MRRCVRHVMLPVLLWTHALPALAQSAESTCGSTGHHEFDFWVGDWEVFRPDGSLAGRNRIEKILDGCVLLENWTSASSAYTGKSFNSYDARTGRWSQVWVDSAGATLHFSGTRHGNVMDLAGTQEDAEGTLHHKLTFTLNADGTVRQHWQQSRDGRQWETVFDGLYRK